MEARARRRLALLSSHVNPLAETSSTTSFSSLVVSPCASGDNGDNEMKEGDNCCVFCKIIRGEAPASKLYEDDECLCILDTYPLCHGHSLIIPKSHYPSLDATPPSIIAAMCSKVPLISNAVMKATGCDSFNLLVNNGAAAGQVIYHTHIHIIPRKTNDCLWTSEVRDVFSSPHSCRVETSDEEPTLVVPTKATDQAGSRSFASSRRHSPEPKIHEQLRRWERSRIQSCRELVHVPTL